MCTESIPASSGAGTWSHSLGHSQDEFSSRETLALAGCAVQEQRACSLPWVAKLSCGSLVRTAEAKELRSARAAELAPPAGGQGSPFPREGAASPGLQSGLASDPAGASLACHDSRVFVWDGETFYLASFIFIIGNFYRLKFLRRQSLKWFYFFPDTCGF